MSTHAAEKLIPPKAGFRLGLAESAAKVVVATT